MDNKQTAVNWLRNESIKLVEQAMQGTLNEDTLEYQISQIVTKAIQMEREQIEYSYDRGVEEGQWTESDNYDIEQCTSSSEFYKKTYGGQDER